MIDSGDAHRQRAYRVRFDWGGPGALTVTEGPGIAVIVDVLSFSTTVAVAVGRGMAVLPHPWRDSRASAYAAAHDAVLAVGRFEQPASGIKLTLSPAAMAGVTGVARVVLPSPNGSTLSALLRDHETGGPVAVLAGCLRNAGAIARWVLSRLGGGTLTVIAAGERWPDGTLRVAVEDLWGAGAVLDHCVGGGLDGLSPEAEVAVAAYRAVRGRTREALRGCVGGRELIDAGFEEDVELAAEVDADRVVPVLRGAAFVAADDHLVT